MTRDGILLDSNTISDAKGHAIGLKSETESLMQRVQKVKSSLNWEVLAEENIDGNLQTIINNLNEQMQFMEAAASVCDMAIDAAEEGNATIISKIAQLIFTIKGILGNTLATTAGAVIGGVIGSAIAIIGNILTSSNSSVAPNTTGTGSESTNVSNTDGVVTGTKEERMANAQNELQNKYNTLHDQRVANGADPAYEQKCGALTYQQLRNDGLTKNDFTASGKDYARVLAEKGVTDTGAKCTGYNSFDEMLNSQKEPITNVVCSWKAGGWVGSADPNSKKYNPDGHAMLISRIEDGNVYFMDNRSDMSDRTAGNRHLIMQCMSIQEFKNKYYTKTSNPTGVTVVSK